MRRYSRYKRRYKYYRLFKFTRNEKIACNIIIELIELLITIIAFIFKFTYSIIVYFIKTTKNMYVLNKIGYAPDEVTEIMYTLSPRGFEVFIAELYKAHGYKAILTPNGNDYGRDVILKTDDGDIFIECKRYSKDHFVGREICQKLLGATQMFNASKGIICTTGKFNNNAYEVERMVNNLKLMDSTDIMCMFMDLDSHKISRILLKSKNVS